MKFSFDRIRQMSCKWMLSTKPQEEQAKKRYERAKERSRKELSEGPQERGAKEALMLATEATGGTVSELSRAAKPRERSPQPPPIVLKVISIPPSPEAGTTIESERVLTSPMASTIAEV